MPSRLVAAWPSSVPRPVLPIANHTRWCPCQHLPGSSIDHVSTGSSIAHVSTPHRIVHPWQHSVCR
eukprot:2929991-Rhodomonas_salina.1